MAGSFTNYRNAHQMDSRVRVIGWQNQLSNPTSTDAFAYDGEGNRVAQQVNGTTTFYLLSDAATAPPARRPSTIPGSTPSAPRPSMAAPGARATPPVAGSTPPVGDPATGGVARAPGAAIEGLGALGVLPGIVLGRRAGGAVAASLSR